MLTVTHAASGTRPEHSVLTGNGWKLYLISRTGTSSTDYIPKEILQPKKGVNIPRPKSKDVTRQMILNTT